MKTKDWPGVYSCKFLEGGIVSYEDSQAGIALLKKETIDRMSASFIGKPVIIDHQSVGPEDFSKAAVGYVIGVSFNPQDAWFYADFIITDDAAKKCIEEDGYSVSCAFNVLDVGAGGLWHDIKFDGEILDGSFTHLALVTNPRYEESKITKQLPSLLVNGKPAHHTTDKQEDNMFKGLKIFKKAANDKQEEVTDLHVEIDGKFIPVTELAEHYANSKPAEKRMAKDEDLVDVNGNTISVGEMVAHYKKTKMNAADETPEEKKKREEAEAKNAKDEADKKEKEAADLEAKNAKAAADLKAANEKQNAKKEGEKFFVELQNAGTKMIENGAETPAPLTRRERAENWKKKNSVAAR